MSDVGRGDRRMTALDAAFFHLERRGQLLHVGGIYTADGPLDFERTRNDLAAKLHLIPRYTERVVPVPFNLGHPTWEPDPNFNLRHHVLRHVLRPPGDDNQLVKLASRLFAEPLHRGRALWEIHQIDGYRGDRSALLAKVHHAMIDGVSGVELLGVMFDVTPRPSPVTPPPDDLAPPPRLPTPTVQLARALRESVATGIARARAAAELVRRPADALSALGDLTATMGEAVRLVATPTPYTPFNGHVSVLRQVAWWTTSLNEVKAIKNRLGGTVNDAVLTTISAALRGYLDGRGFATDRLELRAMVPVNVRKASEKGNLGNRVSMMVAPLPVGIFDPLERLRQVRTAMAKLKESGQVTRMTRLLDLMELLPPAVQKPLGWLQVQAAPVNTVCTNVPGPPVSLYFQGKRLETLVPFVPLAQGVGLAFAILTYADSMTIGITADPALVPDVDRFPALLQAGHEELRVLAAVAPDERSHVPPRPERQRRAESAPSRVA